VTELIPAQLASLPTFDLVLLCDNLSHREVHFGGRCTILKTQIKDVVEHCNIQQYRESTNNLTPADVYFGIGRAILEELQRTKPKIITQRPLLNDKAALRLAIKLG
jgi:hypothetical protein